jgi:hypothetical protein
MAKAIIAYGKRESHGPQLASPHVAVGSFTSFPPSRRVRFALRADANICVLEYTPAPAGQQLGGRHRCGRSRCGNARPARACCRASSAGEFGRRELSIQRGASASTFGCVAACVVPSGVGGAGGAGGGGDETSGGAEVAAVVVAGFGFARAAGGFKAASWAMTESGVMTVVGALPASPVCMELDSFTAMRTGTLCG